MPAYPNLQPYGDETSLGDLVLKVLRFYREFGLLLFLLAAISSLCVAAWIQTHPVFSISAILDTPQYSLDQWRRVEPLLTDRNLVAASVADSVATGDVTRAAIVKSFSNPSFWQRNVRYRAALQRDDIKDAPNVDLRNASNLGIEISVQAPDDERIVLTLNMIIHHISEAMLWNGLHEILQTYQARVAGGRPQLQAELVQKQFSIEQDGRRIAEMRRLLMNYPELRTMVGNSVVSVQDGGGKYLSPLAQIVALEVSISNAKAEIDKARRNLEQLELYAQYLERVQVAAQGIHSGSRLAALLRDQAHNLFEPMKPLSSAAQEVYSDIDLKIAGSLMNVEFVRLKALPALPNTPVLSRQPVSAAVIAFLFVLVSASVALAVYRVFRQLGMKDGHCWSAFDDPLFKLAPPNLRALLLGRRQAPSGENL